VEEEEDSSAKDVDGQRRRLGIELETNVVEGANTGPRAEAGGPGMAYPASATALNQHSAFASTIAGGTPPASNPNGHIGAGTGHLPAPAAPRPTDFSVSSLLTAASSHPPGILGGSSSQGSASPPPGGPGSPAAAPETPPPLPASGQRDLSHPSSAVAAASYFSAAALAAAGFYNPAAHLPPTSSPGPTAVAAAHHLQSKGILAGAHHHPHLNPHGITPPGEHSERHCARSARNLLRDVSQTRQRVRLTHPTIGKGEKESASFLRAVLVALTWREAILFRPRFRASIVDSFDGSLLASHSPVRENEETRDVLSLIILPR